MNTPKKRFFTPLFFLLSLCLATIACTQQINSQPDNQAQVTSKPDTLDKPLTERKKITNIIRLQCDTNQQCESIGIGHRACGGFAEFLPYSTNTTDITWLKKQVHLYNRNEKESNQLKGAMGICQHLMQPKTSCVKNLCVNNQLNAF